MASGEKTSVVCSVCGRTRLVDTGHISRYHSNDIHCKPCALKIRSKSMPAEQAFAWKGGRFLKEGYVILYIENNHPYINMAVRNPTRKGGYVLEHRLVMANCLGRPLTDSELVHHKDGNKLNNSINNLYLTTRANHRLGFGHAYQEGYEAGYEAGYEEGRNGDTLCYL